MKNKVSVLFLFAGILFAACMLISNLLAVKIIQIGPWAAPAGVLIFPLAYIINDVIAEVWGYRKARLIIWSGLAVNLMAVVFYLLAIVLPAAPFYPNSEAFRLILGSSVRIVLASLLAYLTGSFLNAFVMSRVKVLTNGQYFSFRAIASTLVGESADSFIFITVAFAGIYSPGVLGGMIFTQALLKTVYELLILPLTIVVVRWVKRMEGVDVYDRHISYNPFKFREI